jgi:hypothetical protein
MIAGNKQIYSSRILTYDPLLTSPNLFPML